jgi:hypothetical protein
MNLWLDADPPTWEWEHDPSYLSLRSRRILQRANDAWNNFVLSSETRWTRFLNTGKWEPRERRGTWR